MCLRMTDVGVSVIAIITVYDVSAAQYSCAGASLHSRESSSACTQSGGDAYDTGGGNGLGKVIGVGAVAPSLRIRGGGG